MNTKTQFLFVLLLGIFGSAHQIPKQLRSTFNSTFLTDNKQLFRPIIIPNITNYLERSNASNSEETVKAENSIQRSFFRPQEYSEGRSLAEAYPAEERKVNENPQKFSSRYSTEKNDLLKDTRSERAGEKLDQSQVKAFAVADTVNSVEVTSRSDDNSESGRQKLFSDRSDSLSSSEEETEDEYKYFDTSEPEESEVAPTTDEPYRDSQSGPYSEEFASYETTSTLGEEKDIAEEEERPVNDYYDSSSKNYNSVQTPLGKIKYRGPHSFKDGFDSLKDRPRLVAPIRRLPTAHKWPYSGSQVKAEDEQQNEISESDERGLDEEIKEELRGKPSLGLELAVEKDESKFGRNQKYNQVKDRHRGQQKLKSLIEEEEKDHRLPFRNVQQYEVEEEPKYQYPKNSPKLLASGIWPGVSPGSATSKNIFRNQQEQSTKTMGFDIPHELTPKFHSQQFLGPVIFNHSLNQGKTKLLAKNNVKKFKKEPTRHAITKDLLEREKLDQDNLNNIKIHKTLFNSGSASSSSQSFNHLEESEELYSAILANIQSVFGLRTQPLKAGPGGRSSSEVDLEESKTLTWSLPLIKGSKANREI